MVYFRGIISLKTAVFSNYYCIFCRTIAIKCLIHALDPGIRFSLFTAAHFLSFLLILLAQLLNLHYVGVTRAIDVCYIMNGSRRYRSKYKDFVNADPSAFLNMPGLSERRRNVEW